MPPDNAQHRKHKFSLPLVAITLLRCRQNFVFMFDSNPEPMTENPPPRRSVPVGPRAGDRPLARNWKMLPQESRSLFGASAGGRPAFPLYGAEVAQPSQPELEFVPVIIDGAKGQGKE